MMKDLETQHEDNQLPDVEELKTNLAVENASSLIAERSLFRSRMLLILLLLTTITLSVVVGVVSSKKTKCKEPNRSIILDASLGAPEMEIVIRNVVAQKGIVNKASDYQIKPRSVQDFALNMVMKESKLTQELVIQHYALWCFYFATEHVRTTTTDNVFGLGTVPHWKDSWTNDGSDPCLWNGVRCKSSGFVAELNLASSQITGTLPIELQLLDSLTTLDLNDNPGLGNGDVPTWLKNMKLLDFIDVRKCSFSGTVKTELCDSTNFFYADCTGEDFSCSCCNLCA